MKTGLGFVQGHWKWHHLIDRILEFLFTFHSNYADADADEFIKLVARGLNRYNIIKRDNMYTIKEHNYTVNGKRKQLSE